MGQKKSVEIKEEWTVTVLSWNVGRLGDWKALCNRHEGPKEERWNLMRELINAAIKQGCQVMALQEVDTSACLRTIFKGDEWDFVGLDQESEDCVIAYHTKRFKLSSVSWNSHAHHGVGCTLVERGTNISIHIVSAHLYGFNIYAADPLDSKDGDTMLANFLDERVDHRAAISIVGLDANAPPQHARMSIFSKRGYLRSADCSTPTAFNKDVPERRAKLDYVYARCNDSANVNVTDVGAFGKEFPLETPQKNPSDHAPVLCVVRVTPIL